MKYSHTLQWLLVFGMLVGCRHDCPDPILPACTEQPPVGELCQAAFQRWFYQKEGNRCVQISYSGCSSKGFESQEACEACRCK